VKIVSCSRVAGYTSFVAKDAVAIGALIGAIAGAALAAYVQKLWTSDPTDADEFGRRLAKLEAEIEELELLQRRRKSRRGSGEPGRAARVPPASQPQPSPSQPS
jgi:hypothetical protein